LRTIGNVVTGDDKETQYAIDCGALLALSNMIYTKKKSVRKEVCWTLSNITAGTEAQI
jgi:importin subunit alpha-1